MPVRINEVEKYASHLHKILDLLQGHRYPYLALVDLGKSIPISTHRVRDCHVIEWLCEFILFTAQHEEDANLYEELICSVLQKLVQILLRHETSGVDFRQADLITLCGDVGCMVDNSKIGPSQIKGRKDSLVFILTDVIQDCAAALDRDKYPIETAANDLYMSQFD